jgi:hypothetical protein
VNDAVKHVAPAVEAETAKLLEKIKPTQWGELKTDAIDFSQPFLWFDDDLLAEEREVLKAHNALDGHVMVDLFARPEQLPVIAAKYFSV